jgi:hypothetical protein
VSRETLGYVDGMGESGLAELVELWRELSDGGTRRASAYFMVFRVPLAASEESQRSFKQRYDMPPTWKQLREDHGVGRYEVVLMGPPPMVEPDGWKRNVRRLAYALCPWLDSGDYIVPRGRACAAMFDTIDFGMIKPPVPKPIATPSQPSLFNAKDAELPKYVKTSDTSFLAAEAIAPFVTKLQEMVLNVALSAGTRGLTCDEVEQLLEMPHQTASARVHELGKAHMNPDGFERPQMLFDSGARRKTRHGQLATVWVHRTVLFG